MGRRARPDAANGRRAGRAVRPLYCVPRLPRHPTVPPVSEDASFDTGRLGSTRSCKGPARKDITQPGVAAADAQRAERLSPPPPRRGLVPGSRIRNWCETGALALNEADINSCPTFHACQPGPLAKSPLCLARLLGQLPWLPRLCEMSL